MKYFAFIFLFVSCALPAQIEPPILNLENSIKIKNPDAIEKVKLKKNEILISFFQDGGLGYQLDINNFVFKENGKVFHTKERVYYRNGKKHHAENQKLSRLREVELFEVINSDYFISFSKLTQANFKASSKNNQICSTSFVDDAPTNYIIIKQNNKQKEISVYLPKANEYCTEKSSTLSKFIKLHNLFGVQLDW